jgi:tetratricopeptide (TPR) repeat protein
MAEAYSVCAESQSDLAQHHFMRACKHFENSEMKSTLEELNQAIAIDPLFANAVFFRGYLFARLFLFEEAMPDLNLAACLLPEEAFVFLVRAEVLLFLSRKEEAFSDFDYALKLDPHFLDSIDDPLM